MTEIIGRSGRWMFDADVLRIVPASDRRVAALRRALGEISVPLRAIAGVAYEPGRKSGGRLRLRLREGADPLWQVAGGRLTDRSDPYQLAVPDDRTGVAEFLTDEVRHALDIDEVPSGPVERYLVSGPRPPVGVDGYDGSAFFDGRTVRVTWNWRTSKSKRDAGPRVFELGELAKVEWRPGGTWDRVSDRYGTSLRRERAHLRFVSMDSSDGGSADSADGDRCRHPDHDPACVRLRGMRAEAAAAGAGVLLAAAVTARLAHPYAEG